MSCFIVSSQSICNLGQFLNELCRSGNYYVNPNGVRSVFANKYGYDTAREIAKKLYCLNIKAVEERYDSKFSDDFEDFETFANGVSPMIPSLNNFELEDWICIFKKIQCFIYQCSEGTCYESPVYKALTGLEANLGRFIVSELPEYKEIEWD